MIRMRSEFCKVSCLVSTRIALFSVRSYSDEADVLHGDTSKIRLSASRFCSHCCSFMKSRWMLKSFSPPVFFDNSAVRPGRRGRVVEKE